MRGMGVLCFPTDNEAKSGRTVPLKYGANWTRSILHLANIRSLSFLIRHQSYKKTYNSEDRASSSENYRNRMKYWKHTFSPPYSNYRQYIYSSTAFHSDPVKDQSSSINFPIVTIALTIVTTEPMIPRIFSPPDLQIHYTLCYHPHIDSSSVIKAPRRTLSLCIQH